MANEHFDIRDFEWKVWRFSLSKTITTGNEQLVIQRKNPDTRKWESIAWCFPDGHMVGPAGGVNRPLRWINHSDNEVVKK